MSLLAYLQKQEEIYTHVTKDGKEIPLTELETTHLKNIIRWQLSIANRGILWSSSTWSVVKGDIFIKDFEELFNEDALKAMNHDLYVAELKRRTIESNQL